MTKNTQFRDKDRLNVYSLESDRGEERRRPNMQNWAREVVVGGR